MPSTEPKILDLEVVEEYSPPKIDIVKFTPEVAEVYVLDNFEKVIAAYNSGAIKCAGRSLFCFLDEILLALVITGRSNRQIQICITEYFREFSTEEFEYSIRSIKRRIAHLSKKYGLDFSNYRTSGSISKYNLRNGFDKTHVGLPQTLTVAKLQEKQYGLTFSQLDLEQAKLEAELMLLKEDTEAKLAKIRSDRELAQKKTEVLILKWTSFGTTVQEGKYNLGTDPDFIESDRDLLVPSPGVRNSGKPLEDSVSPIPLKDPVLGSESVNYSVSIKEKLDTLSLAEKMAEDSKESLKVTKPLRISKPKVDTRLKVDMDDQFLVIQKRDYINFTELLPYWKIDKQVDGSIFHVDESLEAQRKDSFSSTEGFRKINPLDYGLLKDLEKDLISVGDVGFKNIPIRAKKEKEEYLYNALSSFYPQKYIDSITNFELIQGGRQIPNRKVKY